MNMRVLVLLGMFVSMLIAGTAHAEEYFNNRYNYNIYFRAGEETISFIRDVEIEGFKEIRGRLFLVVKSRGFKLSDEEGYILFDSISAILPERNFEVQKVNYTIKNR